MGIRLNSGSRRPQSPSAFDCTYSIGFLWVQLHLPPQVSVFARCVINKQLASGRRLLQCGKEQLLGSSPKIRNTRAYLAAAKPTKLRQWERRSPLDVEGIK
jgi:hypothetical protein